MDVDEGWNNFEIILFHTLPRCKAAVKQTRFNTSVPGSSSSPVALRCVHCTACLWTLSSLRRVCPSQLRFLPLPLPSGWTADAAQCWSRVPTEISCCILFCQSNQTPYMLHQKQFSPQTKCCYYMPKAFIAVVRDHFSEIIPANRNRLERNFTARRRFTCMLSCKLLASSAKRAQNGGEKAHFPKIFVSKTTHSFTHFPAANFRDIWTQNVNRCRDALLRNRISNFFRQWIIYSKT